MKKFVVLFAVLVAIVSACGGQSQDSESTNAPDFTLPNSFGGEISLDDYNGKNVLLFFHMAVG